MNAFLGRSGKVSMMRVLSAVVVGTAMVLWAAANIKCLITGCPWVAPDVQTVTMVLGAMACKAGQAALEPKTTNEIPTDLRQ